nr:hypothetical protein B0A51_17954 [Rachicladosporium sp. CCFEE 5018]
MAGAAEDVDKKQPHAEAQATPQDARPTSSPTMQAYSQDPSQYYSHPPNEQQARSHSPSQRDAGAQMALPGIHQFEGQQQMQSRAQYAPVNGAHTQHMMHAPPYASNMMAYQPQPMLPTMPSNAPNGQNGMMRYPLPPQAGLDARSMAGGRKTGKEIKRRTKTGCMTCRKRRIKCDEGVPSCRNCAKSKRECLGYDPIFKPSNGPPNLKPVPSPTSLEGPSPHDAGAGSRYQYSTYPVNGGYAPHPPSGDTQRPPPFTYQPPLETQSHAHGPPQMQRNSAASVTLGATSQLVPIEDLYSLDDIPPPYLPKDSPQPQSHEVGEVAAYFSQRYAPGLDRLFETTWYSTRGQNRIYEHAALRDFVLQCMTQLRSNDGTNTANRSLEAKLVWTLALLPLSALAQSPRASDALLITLEPRVLILQALLTGSSLSQSHVPLPPRPLPERSNDEDKATFAREYFWHHLLHFSTLSDSPVDAEQADVSLAAMRGVLNVLENRDVLYSIAVTRHIGARLPDWRPGAQIQGSPEDADKLRVAHHFVEQEAGSGTSQVVQRICSMALRGWGLRRRR